MLRWHHLLIGPTLCIDSGHEGTNLGERRFVGGDKDREWAVVSAAMFLSNAEIVDIDDAEEHTELAVPVEIVEHRPFVFRLAVEIEPGTYSTSIRGVLPDTDSGDVCRYGNNGSLATAGIAKVDRDPHLTRKSARVGIPECVELTLVARTAEEPAPLRSSLEPVLAGAVLNRMHGIDV